MAEDIGTLFFSVRNKMADTAADLEAVQRKYDNLVSNIHAHPVIIKVLVDDQALDKAVATITTKLKDLGKVKVTLDTSNMGGGTSTFSGQAQGQSQGAGIFEALLASTMLGSHSSPGHQTGTVNISPPAASTVGGISFSGGYGGESGYGPRIHPDDMVNEAVPNLGPNGGRRTHAYDEPIEPTSAIGEIGPVEFSRSNLSARQRRQSGKFDLSVFSAPLATAYQFGRGMFSPAIDPDVYAMSAGVPGNAYTAGNRVGQGLVRAGSVIGQGIAAYGARTAAVGTLAAISIANVDATANTAQERLAKAQFDPGAVTPEEMQQLAIDADDSGPFGFTTKQKTWMEQVSGGVKGRMLYAGQYMRTQLRRARAEQQEGFNTWQRNYNTSRDLNYASQFRPLTPEEQLQENINAVQDMEGKRDSASPGSEQQYYYQQQAEIMRANLPQDLIRNANVFNLNRSLNAIQTASIDTTTKAQTLRNNFRPLEGSMVNIYAQAQSAIEGFFDPSLTQAERTSRIASLKENYAAQIQGVPADLQRQTLGILGRQVSSFMNFGGPVNVESSGDLQNKADAMRLQIQHMEAPGLPAGTAQIAGQVLRYLAKIVSNTGGGARAGAGN